MDKDKLIKGLEVTYIPNHARLYENHPDRELGKVSSWNNKIVFVDYGRGTSIPTTLDTLKEGDHTFYCADEWNSVTDGAFGRCAKVCNNCKVKPQ